MARVCSKCKAIYTAAYDSLTKCKWCGTQFDVQQCSCCFRLLPIDEFYIRNGKLKCKVCKECTSYKSKSSTAKRRDMRVLTNNLIRNSINDRYQRHVSELTAKDQKMLKDIEWYNICRLFNGCAICSSEYSDVKAIVVKPSDGGKLSKYNVLPMCSDCFAIGNRYSNMFASFHPETNKKSTMENYKRFVDCTKLILKEW